MKYNKIKLIFSGAFLALLLFFREPYSVLDQLESIPKEERQSLEFFFRSAVAFDSFGYCLFGDKPLSVLVYSESAPKGDYPLPSCDSRFSYYHPFNKRIKQGWEIWEKNNRKFHFENYALIKCKNFVDNNFSAVVLINKKAVLQIIDANLNDFKSILGEHVTAKWLLEEILKSKDVFSCVLKNHQGLIGTLLGYGRNNAWAFHIRHEAQQVSRKKGLIRMLDNAPEQKKWKALNKRLKSFTRGQRFNPLFMNLPVFAADLDSMETQILRIKYEQNYQTILHRYKEGDFLEITLQQLTSE
jgi:hypothetical protein